MRRSATRSAVGFLCIFGMVVGTGMLGFLHCARNNPLDSKGNNFIPGAAPEARFIDSAITRYINTRVVIPLYLNDTAAVGGRTPRITHLLLNWSGDSLALTDTIPAPDNDTIDTMFTAGRETVVFMRARDNDDSLSALSKLWLRIEEGRPRILSLSSVPQTPYAGDTVTFSASATDDNPSTDSLDFIWTVDNTAVTTTKSSVFSHVFTTVGTHKVVVRVRDPDNMYSAPDSVTINVAARPVVVDTLGPDIRFIMPRPNDTVNNPLISILVETWDTSGVSAVYIGNQEAELAGGTLTRNTWKRDSVEVVEGNNTITTFAVDTRGKTAMKPLGITYSRTAADRTPPVITPVSPKAGDTVYFASVTVLAQITDASSAVDSVKCNGKPMARLTGSQYGADSVTLTEGLDTIVISARDDKGNQDSLALPVFFKRETIVDSIMPQVFIFSPRKGSTVESRACTVSVSASDAISGIDSVTVNTLRALHIGGLEYVRIIQLNHGPNTIIARAVDRSGNQKADTTFVIQNTKPSFTLSAFDTNLVQGVTASIPVSATDDDSDSLFFTMLTAPAKSATQPVLIQSGKSAAIESYTPDQSGVDTFRVLVTDAFAASDTLLVRVFITLPQETKPFFTTKISELPDSATVGLAYTARLAAVDPNNKPLSFSFKKPPSPQGAQVDAEGRISWIPATADSGLDTLFALVSNATESDTLRWTVRVIMPNQPPRLADPKDTTINEGQTLRITLQATDPDNDPLSFSMASFPSGAQLSGATFVWTPTFKQAGSYSVLFRVRETNRTPPLTDSQLVVITVRDVNHPPILAPIGAKSVVERATLTFVLAASDTNGDSLTFSMTSPPQGATIVPLNRSSARFSWTPLGTQAGTYSVTFKTSDNGIPVMLDSETVMITVRDTVRPAFETDPGSMQDTVFVGNAYRDTVLAVDKDGDTIIYRKLTGPAWLSVESTSGIVLGTPEPKDNIPAITVSITAEDHAGLKDTLSWSLAVLPLWPRIWGGPSTLDTGFAVIEAGGGYALCGTIAAPALNSRWPFLIRTDDRGNPVSYKLFSSATSKQNAYSIAQASNGGYVLCGTDSAASEQLLLLKTNIAGDTLDWTAKFSAGGIDVSGNVTRGIAVYATREGGYIACGASARRSGSGTNSVPFMVKTNSAGKEEWQKEYANNALGNAAAYSVMQTADDGYLLAGEAGTRGGTLTDTDLLLVKTDAKGDTLWTRTYHRGSRDIAVCVQQTTGGYIVGGYSVAGLTTSVTGFVMKVSATGDTLWTRAVTSAGGVSTITSVRMTDDGGFIAAGSALNTAGNSEDALLIKFTADGKEEWRKMYGGPLADRANAVTTVKDAGYLFTGFTTRTINNVTSADIYLVKTDESGAVVEK